MNDRKTWLTHFRRWIAVSGVVLMSGAMLWGCGKNKEIGVEIQRTSEGGSGSAAESADSNAAESAGSSAAESTDSSASESGSSAPADGETDSAAEASASETGGHGQALPVQMFVDGEESAFGSLSPESPEDLRVYITLDGMVLTDLPFGEEHTIRILQINGDENTVHVTQEAVFMEASNCQNHDCVMMGQITRDNLEMRVMGGFIICLPHRLSVEVRGR